MSLVERIERGLGDVEDAHRVARLLEALAALMAAYPCGARETAAYRQAEQALADALALRRDWAQR